MRFSAGKWLLVAAFIAVPTAALAAVPGLYLGRSADLGDAVPASTVLDDDAPTVSVKVTNRTGEEAELIGWLNGEVAKAVVPARSAIVKLSWPAMPAGRAKLELTLRSGDLKDSEVHDVTVRPSKYGYGYPTPSVTPSHSRSPSPSPSPSMSKSPSPSPSMSRSPSASPSMSRSPSASPSMSKSPSPSPSMSRSPSASPSMSTSPTPSPSRSKSKSPSPSPSLSGTPTPSPSGTLPTTGDEVGSYVLLGGGMLAFGLFVLGLAWVLGRRSRVD